MALDRAGIIYAATPCPLPTQSGHATAQNKSPAGARPGGGGGILNMRLAI